MDPVQLTDWKGWEKIGALIVFLIGDFNAQLAYLLVVICVDTYFGMRVARKKKEFSWRKLFGLLFGKLFIYCPIIIMLHAGDQIIGSGGSARQLGIMALFASNAYSTIHHLAALGFGDLNIRLQKAYDVLIGDTFDNTNGQGGGVK